MDPVAIYKQEEIEMKGSLVIISFFIIGIAAGLSGLIPSGISEGNLTFYALCALLFCVGAGVGSDNSFISKFKTLDPRMSLLPVGTLLGTLAGALAAALLLHGRSATDCLAVGSGFGYYYLHYRVQGSGTRYHRIALEHCPGDVHIAPVTTAGKSGRAIGSDRCRRSDFDGHDIAYHHGLIRQAICCGFVVPRLCARVFNTVHRHLLVHPIEGSDKVLFWSAYLLLNYLILHLMYKKDIFIKV